MVLDNKYVLGKEVEVELSLLDLVLLLQQVPRSDYGVLFSMLFFDVEDLEYTASQLREVLTSIENLIAEKLPRS